MSAEEDRAAKAARAKAMLKKRQQKKAAGPSTSSPLVAGPSSPTPSSPVSRALSPPLPDAPSSTDTKSDFSDVFSQRALDTSWLSSLPRAETPSRPSSSAPRDITPALTPPPPVQAATPPPVAASPPPVKDDSSELRETLRSRDETIARIEADKSSLESYQASATREVDALRVELQKREERICVLASDKDALTENAQSLQRELEGKQHEASTLQTRQSTLEAELQARAQTIASLTSNNARLESYVEDTSRTLEQQTETIKTLTAERVELKLKYEDLDQKSHTQHTVIQLLVDEKASLMDSVQHKDHLEAELEGRDKQLKEEQERSQAAEAEVERVQGNIKAAVERLKEVNAKEQALNDKCRDQERELQITNGTVEELRTASEHHQRKVRELEDQIQSDDRVEVLESSLKHTQERADELEFQVTKLKQAQTTLRIERDELDSVLNTHRASETKWKEKHAEAEKAHSTLQEQLTTALAEKEALAAEKASLETTSNSTQKDFAALQAKLSHAASELTAHGKQLQTVQSDLKKANRRAEEAEKAQADLQAEGQSLLRSLEEMRPKIVELTQTKLELGERIEGMENTIRKRDAVISQLEGAIDEARHEKEEAESQLGAARSAAERDGSSTQAALNELQAAYWQLNKELKAAQAARDALKADREDQGKLVAGQVEELENLASSLQKQSKELISVRRELNERKQAQEDEKNFLDRAQTEIEALRIELTTKEEEIEQLQASYSQSSSKPRSLDDEMLSALRQQHSMDLSEAASKLRAVESSLFDADARSHALQKQVSSLEDQLRSVPRTPQRPGLGSRPSSVRPTSHSDLRKASFSSHRPSNLATAPARLAFEESLSPETRHKRQVSLSMLKARIDSERAAATPSRSLTPIPSSRRGSAASTSTAPDRAQLATPYHRQTHHNLQFLDESHIFMCHSCHGDIVVL